MEDKGYGAEFLKVRTRISYGFARLRPSAVATGRTARLPWRRLHGPRMGSGKGCCEPRLHGLTSLPGASPQAKTHFFKSLDLSTILDPEAPSGFTGR